MGKFKKQKIPAQSHQGAEVEERFLFFIVNLDLNQSFFLSEVIPRDRGIESWEYFSIVDFSQQSEIDI